jgi:hypothetical protein
MGTRWSEQGSADRRKFFQGLMKRPNRRRISAESRQATRSIEAGFIHTSEER